MSKAIKNSDFLEAKERLGLLTVGDPGSSDKLQINDTFLVTTARKLDKRLKNHPQIKQSLIKVRGSARKVKNLAKSLTSRNRKIISINTSAPVVGVSDIISSVRFPKNNKPTVSIIIPAFNKAEYSAACLKSLSVELTNSPTYEVILVDNGSSDDTHLLANIPNIVYIKNKENLGFVGGCNSGLAKSKGEYVVFLNNDAEITRDWLPALYETINHNPTIGLVGSKIIYPNGVLQEAGGIIFKDANGLNYGKFDQANSYQYNYVRDVDYCSGASIIIKRSLMDKFGGFDILYHPAYYEDTDLSFKVRAEGLRVVYQPKSVIYHIEGGTAGTSTSSGFKKYQAINKDKFLKRWKKDLQSSHVSEQDWYLGRDRSGTKLALIIEESIPTPDKDSGSVRMIAIIKNLQSLGYKVTFWPNDLIATSPYTENLQQIGVEVVYGNVDFMQFSKLFGNNYDLVIMSRPEIGARYINMCRTLYLNAKLIYDTVDLHYLRLARQAEIETSNSEALIEQSRWYEILEKGLMERVDATLVVSPKEIDILKNEEVNAKLAVVSNIHTVKEEAFSVGYNNRKDIIFVGNYAHLPNRDAIRWFVDKIWPTILKKESEVKLHVVGANMPDDIKRDISGKNVIIDGFVSDQRLGELLISSRVFIAPLRYGAGVKGKIGQAIEYGVPIVTTSIGSEGMFLENASSCLVADSEEDFAKAVCRLYGDRKKWKTLQEQAKCSLREHFSSEVARRNIQLLLEHIN